MISTYEEPKVVRLPEGEDEQEAVLEGWTSQGWHLVSVDGGRAYFVRLAQFSTMIPMYRMDSGKERLRVSPR